MVAHINRIMEMSSHEGFVQYQVDITLGWAMRQKLQNPGKKRKPTWVPNHGLLIPPHTRIAGPGSVPFCASMAPNLFDLPGDDNRPVKRMRMNDECKGPSLESNATKTHKSHARMVTNYLCESSKHWKFLGFVCEIF